MKRAMTAAEVKWVSEATALGCMVSGQPAEWHHMRNGSYTRVYGIVGGARRAPHVHGIPLAPEFHRGAQGIHTLGAEQWEELYGEQVDHYARLCRIIGPPPNGPERKSRNRRPAKIVPR